MKSIWLIICAGTLMVGTILQLGYASEEAPARTITVTGSGEVRAQPDTARLRVGVVTHAVTAQAAMDTNAATMRRLFRGLADFGVASQDIQTTDLAIAPQYKQQRAGAPETPDIEGYQVRNTVQVTVRDLNRLGALVDTLVRLGANQLYHVNFLIENDAALLDKARVAAVHEARRKAQLFSTAAGVQVGRVLSIHEAGSSQPPPIPMRHTLMAESVPVAPGEQALTVQVTVVFALEENPSQ